jgi:hypothetical protein
MEQNRKLWNVQQKEFRRILLSFRDHEKAINLFMMQHGLLHSVQIEETLPWSFADEILSDLREDLLRQIPNNADHSLAWIIWHIARIEDVTMNMLVAGQSQLYLDLGWKERIKVAALDTGNVSSRMDVEELSNTVDLQELQAYRLAVGRRTREIVRRLSPKDLKEMVEPARLEQVMNIGAVSEKARDLIDYWSRRNIGGLLLMPATRHNFVHLNEAARLKPHLG